jgi:hypothetical protein
MSLGTSAQQRVPRPVVTVGDMFQFGTGAPMTGATILTRRGSSVSLELSTTGLQPFGAYSLWWAVFNNPEKCTQGVPPDRCGVPDLPGLGGDPAIDAVLLWGGGGVAGFLGDLTLSAELERRQPPGEVVMGNPRGLNDVFGADIHVVIRSHGAAVPGGAAAQIGSFNGGCPPAGCTNVQFSVHQSD